MNRSRKLLIGIFVITFQLFLPPSAVSAAPRIDVVSSKLRVQNRVVMTWVQVTRPMYVCESTDDSKELRALFLSSYLHWRDGKAPANGCKVLQTGEVFLLDPAQSESDTQIVVRMLRPVCPRGCVPSMMTVYGPPRNIAGDYLRPTNAPKGW